MNASIRNNHEVKLAQLRQFVPSVLATAPHSSRSKKYGYVPTYEVLGALRDCGYALTFASQSSSRTPGGEGFVKHLLRLRQIEHLGNFEQDVPEIVVINSHNGGSAYIVMLGLFRLVCTNGLIVGDIASRLHVQHRGDIVGAVIAATTRIAEQAPVIMETIGRMKQVETTQDERRLLATFAARARFGDDKVVDGSLSPAGLLVPQRRLDEGKTDLYTVTNTVQENAIKGGVLTGTVAKRGRRSRAVTEIGKSVEVNSLIWQFSQALLAYKSGEAAA